MVDNNKNQIVEDIPQEEKTGEETQQFVGIRFEKEIYGIPIEKTREVTKPRQITTIPGSASHIMGLMNLHGEILCIVDVRTLLNRGKTIPKENSRVIVIKTREGPVGVLCDEVVDICDITKKNIEAPLATLSSEIGVYIKGQAQIQSGLMGILDIEGLLFKQEK